MTEVKLIPEFSDMANLIKRDGLARKAEVELYFLNSLKLSSLYSRGGDIRKEVISDTKDLAAEYYAFANTDGKAGLTKTEVLEASVKLTNSLSYDESHSLMPDTSTKPEC